ncbi:MAG: hydrogen gas-evolving membrane-bound hydrogenase subunit E [Candidatus Omnitrophota bacterium]
MIEIHLLLLFMIAAAIIAVEAKDLLSSVIAVGAVGIGLCMSFLVLKAPDLAIMQLVVEILSLIILIRATIRKDIPFSTSGRWLFNTLSMAAFAVIFLTAAYFALEKMPSFGYPIAGASDIYIKEGMSRTGAMNMISAITLKYRALDTLGEATILFAAVIGVLAVARKASHNKESE